VIAQGTGTMKLALVLCALAALATAAHAAPATAPVPAKSGTRSVHPVGKAAAKPVAAATTRRPLTLQAQTIEGRADAPRVLFVHTGPTIALEDAPKHPSYLRDDFTAALSSPVRLNVRTFEPLRMPAVTGP